MLPGRLILCAAALLLLAAVDLSAQSTLPNAPEPASLAWLASAAVQHRNYGSDQQRARVTEARPAQPYTEPSLWRRKYLYGNWDGERTRMENEGLTMDFYYVADALSNVRGGVHPGGKTWWGRIRGTVDVDFSKLSRWKGLTGHITSVWQYGTNIGGPSYAASYANPSSLASTHVFRAAEYDLTQALFHDHLEIRGGKMASWNTYGTQEYGASYVNEPMGYAFNTYVNTYMTYDPGGTPAFEVRFLPTYHYYVKAMVLSQEKKPYTIDPTGFAFHLGPPVLAAEAGWVHDPPLPPHATKTLGVEDCLRRYETGHYPGTFKFGGSYNPTAFTNQLTGQTSPGNYVIWAQANQAIYREPNQDLDGQRGLDVTFTIDHSPNDVNQQNQQIDAGFRYIGPFRGRRFAKDMLDFGWVRTSDGSAYRASQRMQGHAVAAENLAEINYLANITPWLLFQPTAEFILNPSAQAARSSIMVLGFRTMITF